MKIQLDQIKGALRNRVELAVGDLVVNKNATIIAYFLFNNIDHQYGWRSKGKYVAIRYTTPTCEFQQYYDKPIYLKP